MVFVPMAKAPPTAGAKLLYNLNLIHEFTSLNSPKMIYAGLPRKAFSRKQAFVDIKAFCRTAFYMIWRPVLKSVMLIQGGGGSHSKSSSF